MNIMSWTVATTIIATMVVLYLVYFSNCTERSNRDTDKGRKKWVDVVDESRDMELETTYIERYILEMLDIATETLNNAVDKDERHKYDDALKFYLEGVAYLNVVEIALDYSSWIDEHIKDTEERYLEKRKSYSNRADVLLSVMRVLKYLEPEMKTPELTRRQNEAVIAKYNRKFNHVSTWAGRFVTYAFLHFLSKLVICIKILGLARPDIPV